MSSSSSSMPGMQRRDARSHDEDDNLNPPEFVSKMDCGSEGDEKEEGGNGKEWDDDDDASSTYPYSDGCSNGREEGGEGTAPTTMRTASDDNAARLLLDCAHRASGDINYSDSSTRRPCHQEDDCDDEMMEDEDDLECDNASVMAGADIDDVDDVDDDDFSIMTPGGSSLKACRNCTMLNAVTATRCEACEVPLLGRQSRAAAVPESAAAAAVAGRDDDLILSSGPLRLAKKKEHGDDNKKEPEAVQIHSGSETMDRTGQVTPPLLDRARALADAMESAITNCLREVDKSLEAGDVPMPKIEQAVVRPLPTVDLMLHMASLLDCADQHQPPFPLAARPSGSVRSLLRLYGASLDRYNHDYDSIRLHGLCQVDYSAMFESVDRYYANMLDRRQRVGWLVVLEPRSRRAFPILSFQNDATSLPAVERLFSCLEPLIDKALPSYDATGMAPSCKGCDVAYFLASAERTASTGIDVAAAGAKGPERMPPPRPEPLPEVCKPPPIAFSPMWSPDDSQNATKAPPFSSDVPSIAFLTSDPLIYYTESGEVCPVQHRIDVNAERKDLIHCMKQAALKVNIMAETATPQSLRDAALDTRYRILHFSGLAHGTMLALEDQGRGGPLWLDERGMVRLLAPPTPHGATRPPLAVVTTRCAEQVGRMFLAAGFTHVVCCDKSEDALLELPLNFSRVARVFTFALYSSLASGATLTAAFYHGCKTVRLLPGLGDVNETMRRFRLLPDDGDHRVPIFEASERRGQINRPGFVTAGLRQTNKLHEFLSPRISRSFLGRELDLFKLVQAVHDERTRLLSVTGASGVGKSALVHALCHYLNDRASTTRASGIDRIFYLNLAPQSVSFVSRLTDVLARERVCQESSWSNSSDNVQAVDRLASICHALSVAKALVVLDDVDQWNAQQEGLELEVLIQYLLERTCHVKVICTSTVAVLSAPIAAVFEYPVKGLRSSDALRLFVLSKTGSTSVFDRHELFRSLALSFDSATGERNGITPFGIPDEVPKVIDSGVPSQIAAVAKRSAAVPPTYSLAGCDGPKDSSSDSLLDILYPHRNDVVLVEGARGPRLWRALIQDNREVFQSLPMRQKELLSRSMVTSIRSQHPPGRFLRKNAETGQWYDVGDEHATDLTSISLMEPASQFLDGTNAESDEDSVVSYASSTSSRCIPVDSHRQGGDSGEPLATDELGVSLGSMQVSGGADARPHEGASLGSTLSDGEDPLMHEVWL